MNNIKLKLIKMIMPNSFKEILLDTVFSKNNDDVELLCRQLHKMKLIKKEKGMWVSNEKI